MNVTDWLIVGFVGLLALHGYQRGFVVAALSLAGFAAGAVIGARVGPLVLSQGAHSTYAPLFGLAGALILGSLLGGGLEMLGARARGFMRIPGFRLVDGLLGALLTACIALGVVWLAGAVAVQTFNDAALRRYIQHSAILRGLDETLPPTGPILDALARIDPLPSVNGPPADVPAPTRGILATAGVRRAAPSVVRILGDACGVGLEGSGWVAAPGLVVTNVHVIAGETDTTVQTRGGGGLSAQPVVLDTHNDIAVLSVPGLRARPLPLATGPAAGTSVAILGYPLDGPYDERPGRLGETRLTATDDAYGNGPVLRQVSALRGLVRPGNSGGPLLNASGQVVATVFARITGVPAGRAGGYAVPNSVVAGELGKARVTRATVGSGQCSG